MRHLPPSWTRPVLCCILLLFCVGAPAVAATRNVTTYGATGNGTTNDTAAINSAIAALVSGDELYFPCPTSFYLVTSLDAITVNNVTVAGQTGCSGGTVMVKGSSGAVMTIGAYSVSSSTPFTVASPEKTNTIEANWSAIGVTAGSYIYIEQGGAGGGTHTCGGSGCRSEVLKVISVTGSGSTAVATVETAVHQTYDPSSNLAWAKKILSPVSGVTIQNITIDGSSTANSNLELLNAVNSTVSGLTIQNVVGCGSVPLLAGGGLYALNGYNNSFNNITITHAGSSSNSGFCSAAELAAQGNATVNGFSISNLNAGYTGHGTVGIYINQFANGTVSNLSIDSKGTTAGRPFKVNSGDYNTFNGLTISHTEGGYFNGISIEYFSSHNIFNNCSVTNLSGTNAGIQIFGDSQSQQEGNNNYNTFNNCTINNTTNIPVWILDNNTGNTFNGGTYAGISGEPVFGVGNSGPCCSNNTSINNVTISGPAATGINVANGSTGACINSNTFAGGSGLSAGINVTAASDIGTGNVLNGYASNLSEGTCGGGAAPGPPNGLTASVH